jgi:hypothetical protein
VWLYCSLARVAAVLQPPFAGRLDRVIVDVDRETGLPVVAVSARAEDKKRFDRQASGQYLEWLLPLELHEWHCLYCMAPLYVYFAMIYWADMYHQVLGEKTIGL